MTGIDFHKLFEHHSIKDSPKKYKEVFQILKPSFKEKIIQLLKDRKKSNRGRPCSVDWNKFLDCMFSICDNGTKLSYCKEHYGIARSTYFFYFGIISSSKLLEKFYSEILSRLSTSRPEYVIADTFTVKSMDGSNGLGRNPTDRGRKGLKVSLICDPNLVVLSALTDKANVHDSKLLEPTIKICSSNLKTVKCLADSGYAGRKYIEKIKENTGVNLVSKPKKTRNPKLMSHKLSEDDSELLKKKRNGIELLNGQIRSFRSLMIKYVKTIDSYTTYLYLALICISCYNLFSN